MPRKICPSGSLQSGAPGSSDQSSLAVGLLLPFYFRDKVLSAYPGIDGAACFGVGIPEEWVDASPAIGYTWSYVCQLALFCLLHHFWIGYQRPAHSHQISLPISYYLISHDGILDPYYSHDRQRSILLDQRTEVNIGSLLLIHGRYEPAIG